MWIDGEIWCRNYLVERELGLDGGNEVVRGLYGEYIVVGGKCRVGNL